MKTFLKIRKKCIRMASDCVCRICNTHSEFQPIPLFSLKELPPELKNIDRRYKRIPPVLERQFESFPFQLGRINVTGNGYCGYYVIQLLEYMNNYKIISVLDINVARAKVLQEAKINEGAKKELILAKRHYLEYLEVGMILNKLIPELNIAVIAQTDIKKTGDKRARRIYPAWVVSYKPGQNWSFLLLSHGARHYELLTILEDGRHRSAFVESEAVQIFDCCQSDYPTDKVDSVEQVVFLDAKDFFYF